MFDVPSRILQVNCAVPTDSLEQLGRVTHSDSKSLPGRNYEKAEHLGMQSR